MINGFLGECKDEPYGAPLREVGRSLRAKSRDRMKEKAHTTYSDTLDLELMNATLENLGLDTVESGGYTLATFLDTSATELFTCENIQGLKDDLEYPICTSTIGALGWYVGCLYLMAWTLCCLTLPAGCLVEHDNVQRKREYKAYLLTGGDLREGQDASKAAGERRGEGGEDVDGVPIMVHVSSEDGGEGGGGGMQMNHMTHADTKIQKQNQNQNQKQKHAPASPSPSQDEEDMPAFAQHEADPMQIVSTGSSARDEEEGSRHVRGSHRIQPEP
jgi:hypothetical protein